MAGTADHRIYFAAYRNGEWQYQELAKMGAGLLDTEEDYTGLGVIDLQHGRQVYISTPIDPRNDSKLAHHEIFCGECGADNGSWTWSAITQDSSADNLRPLLPHLANGSSLLLWLQGRYVHQTHYATTVQALRIVRAIRTLPAKSSSSKPAVVSLSKDKRQDRALATLNC